MNSIKTVFVLKKDLYDSESAGLTKDIKNFLKINIKSAKVINKYIIKNVDNSTFEKSLTSVFSEPMVDDYYIDEIPNLKNTIHLLLNTCQVNLTPVLKPLNNVCY